jgi:hypothetical protein
MNNQTKVKENGFMFVQQKGQGSHICLDCDKLTNRFHPMQEVCTRCFYLRLLDKNPAMLKGVKGFEWVFNQ